jgi:hypothetical protein
MMTDGPQSDEGALPDLTRGGGIGAPQAVSLVGDALMTATRIQHRLGLASVKDVVYVGLALLKEAEGKEVIVRDPATQIDQPIPFAWR